MKRIYVEEQWCLGCHLCEYNCAYANSGIGDMVKALKGKPIYPRIRVEESGKITYAVSCRHCDDPLCVKSCISGAMHKEDGVVKIDRNKCSGCGLCVRVCPLNNISIENGRPVWGSSCTHCMACICRCPQEAVEYGRASIGKPRYICPDTDDKNELDI